MNDPWLEIETITFLALGDSKVSMNIRFKGGLTQKILADIPPKTWIQKKTGEDIVQKIDQLLDHHNVAEIVKILNRLNPKSGWGKPFNRCIVYKLIESRGLKTRFERLRKRGLLTSEELARKYNVANSSVRTWYRNQLIKVEYYKDKNDYLCVDPGDRPFQRGRKWFFPERGGRSSKFKRGAV